MFHKEILTAEQTKLLPLVQKYKRKFYLVGGTAIALYLGHRRSIDFDLFTSTKIDRNTLEEKITTLKFKFKTLHQTPLEWTFFIGKVKITFYQFPHLVEHKDNFEKIISLPSLLDLAAMKAYALGGRGKWKDYVDLYFIFKNHFSFVEVAARADALFGDGFNEKLFREQLTYYDDINYSEKVEYLIPEPKEEEIKSFLTQIALQ
ncbi:MAG: nucleotidyl transferase AbiEii/AbiGii toxin family protein [Ignavibacteria bacterium]|nr:nucleotidyl transferase AbiEii/AbiGii toxin family protein [Ignavibacteria bacterium]